MINKNYASEFQLELLKRNIPSLTRDELIESCLNLLESCLTLMDAYEKQQDTINRFVAERLLTEFGKPLLKDD